MIQPDNIKIYDDNALALVKRYESTTTEKALPFLVDILANYSGTNPVSLDIGSGSGRDAFWLAEHGWSVDAIDGSQSLLDKARKLNSHPRIDFTHDLAPDFKNTVCRGHVYDLILMSAFIFHFETAERDTIMKTCVSMLAYSGLIHMTLRRGPNIPDRRIFDVSVDEVRDFARNNNLKFRYHGQIEDSAGADNILWDTVSIWRGGAWNHIGRNSS